jgi:PII-like signaling protein
MSGASPAVRLTVTIGAHEHARHHLLATELLARARRAGLAGATLLSADAHLQLVIVDSDAAITTFVAANADALAGASIEVEPVRAYRA